MSSGRPSLPATMTECEPRYATARTPERETLGRAAGRVARVLGAPLMPWQKQVLDVALEIDGRGQLVYRDVVLSTPRQSGKSYVLLTLLLTRALLWPRQNLIYTAQSGLDARKKLLDDWLPAVQASPIGGQVAAYLAPGRESLRFTDGSVLQLLASTAKAGHGMVVDLGVLDEAFSYQDARTEQALRPAMMTRSNPQLWVVSTAGTPDASPYLFERVQSGRLAVEAGVTDALAYFEWSAEDDADPADPETWRSCMPALGHTVSEDAVAAAQRSMGRSEFARAYTEPLGRFDGRFRDRPRHLDGARRAERDKAGEPDPRRRCQPPLQGRSDRRRGHPRWASSRSGARERPRHRLGGVSPRRPAGGARRRGCPR